MTAENKKTAMYLGGAIVVGAVGFFVYSFFQKPIIVGNTTLSLGNEEDKAPTITPTNPFKEMLAQSQAISPTPFGDMLRDKNWSLVY
jgi:hypothetical protein